LIRIVSGTNMDSVVVLQDDAPSSQAKPVIDQTSLDIHHNSVAEAVGTDLTVMSTSPVKKETDSSPLHVSWTQLEKRNVFLCKLTNNGSRFLYNFKEKTVCRQACTLTVQANASKTIVH